MSTAVSSRSGRRSGRGGARDAGSFFTHPNPHPHPNPNPNPNPDQATTSTRPTGGSCRCTSARPRSTRCTSSPTWASRCRP
eukprot:scaffold21538_cov58-Phaeocystis_antarctica.AAC.5